jgi:putative two-component system response regulator
MIRPLVIIADDDQPLADSLGLLAERAGFHPLVAYDGLAALQLAREQRPRVLVTDLHMPGLSGERLVAEIRKIASLERIPVMVLTSDDSRPTRIRLLRQGADEFVIKPVDPEEFQIRLGLLLRQDEDATTLAVLTSQRILALRKLEKNVQSLERLAVGIIDALETADTLQDPNAGNHIRRVGLLAARLAQARGCQPAFVDQISRYAGLHDVGKVGLPDDVKWTRNVFTPEQREVMTSHADMGARLLRSASMPEIALNIALFHHERIDGSGYPLGLGGDLVPQEARIVGLVDTWDALTSERPWRTPTRYAFCEARSVMQSDILESLDPTLLGCFLEIEGDARAIKCAYSDRPSEPAVSGPHGP